MNKLFQIPVKIFQLLLVLIVPTIILLPIIFCGYLMYNSAWSELFFFFLSTVITVIGTFLILLFSGFLGPIGIISLPIIYAAYVQYDLYFFYFKNFNDSHPIIFAYFFIVQTTITLAFLGKGFEKELIITIFRLMMFVTACVVLFLLKNEVIHSFWHVLGVNGLGLLITFLIVYLLGRKNTESSFEE